MSGSVIISVIVFLIILNGNKGLLNFNANKNLSFCYVYLLTIGLIVSPVINGIFIFFAMLFWCNRFYINKKLGVIIFTYSFYIIFNTCYIFSRKAYVKEYNPYIGLLELLVYCLYILFLSFFNNDSDKQKIIDLMSIFSLGVFIVGFLEFVHNSFSISVRLYSIFRNANLLGIYSTVIFSFNFKNKKTFISNKLKNLIILCNLLLIILSQSRVAWIATIVYLFATYIYADIRTRLKYLIRFAFILSIFLICFREKIEYLYITRIIPSFNSKDFATSDRINLLKAGFEIFKNHMLFGSGIRSFPYEAQKLGYNFWSNNAHHPHNAYMECLQTLGLIGFILQFTLVFFTIPKRNKRSKNFIPILLMFCSIGLLNRLFNEFLTTSMFWMFIVFSQKRSGEVINDE